MNIPPPPSPRVLTTPVLPGGDAQTSKAWKAAQDFEAMALGELLKPMFDTVDLSDTPFGGGPGEDAWKPMLISEIAKKIASAGGLGLAEPVYQQMLRMQEDADAQGVHPKSPTSRRASDRAAPKDSIP